MLIMARLHGRRNAQCYGRRLPRARLRLPTPGGTIDCATGKKSSAPHLAEACHRAEEDFMDIASRLLEEQLEGE